MTLRFVLVGGFEFPVKQPAQVVSPPDQPSGRRAAGPPPQHTEGDRA